MEPLAYITHISNNHSQNTEGASNYDGHHKKANHTYTVYTQLQCSEHLPRLTECGSHRPQLTSQGFQWWNIFPNNGHHWQIRGNHVFPA